MAYCLHTIEQCWHL